MKSLTRIPSRHTYSGTTDGPARPPCTGCTAKNPDSLQPMSPIQIELLFVCIYIYDLRLETPDRRKHKPSMTLSSDKLCTLLAIYRANARHCIALAFFRSHSSHAGYILKL
jgi:hypothetical protein